MSLPRFHSYPFFTGDVITRLSRDFLTLSDGLSAFCFMRVSGFSFGGLAEALVLGVSTGTNLSSSLLSEEAFAVGRVGVFPRIGLIWTRSLEYCVPVASFFHGV